MPQCPHRRSARCVREVGHSGPCATARILRLPVTPPPVATPAPSMVQRLVAAAVGLFLLPWKKKQA